MRSPAPPQQRTQYGTSSLESDEALRDSSAATERRRRIVKWGATALVVSAGAALIAMSVTSGGSSGEVVATTSTAATPSTASTAAAVAGETGKDVKCWQSSYIDGEKKMMESITGLKWKKRAGDDSSASASSIAVDADKKYQEMFGFGGAFTEASALQFAKLSPEKQEEVLKLYFDKEEGSGYEFGRVPMGSCDFSVSSYSFDDVVNDTSMNHFDDSVEHDTVVLIPFIQRALEKNPKMKMFLAPWSPPAWMKRASDIYMNPSMLGSATPVGLKDEAQSAWALYFSKFITAYKAQGINFWGLTPQNEPEFAAPWEACGYNASYQAEFVANHLGPVIKRDHPEVKIMVFDHNRASVRQWAETIFLHPEAKKYVDGIAFHWYDNERYMDGVEFHERLNDTHYVDESRFILATESCNCPGVAQGKDAWFRGQRYAHDIITDFNNWVVGWVDWNLILDHTGGPNHLGNNCDAPIIIDETEKDYYLQPMYYFIQHFSRFAPAGSRRIHTEVSATFKKPGDAQLFTRYPAALHSCDNSSRQAIHVTDDSKLQVTGTPFCLDLVRPQWIGRQVELVECQYTSQSWTFKDGQIRMGDHCLMLNHGSTKDGTRVTVHDCRDTVDAVHEQWHFKHGQMHSAASDKCVTAGYSFVQSVGFVTPDDKKVLVVLNENTEDADFELQFGGESLETTIPQGAIRTFTWE
ncbi:Glucosylceramidase [Globisporangium polare]